MCSSVDKDQGCLPGLVVFLDNRNPEVIATALEVRATDNRHTKCTFIHCSYSIHVIMAKVYSHRLDTLYCVASSWVA